MDEMWTTDDVGDSELWMVDDIEDTICGSLMISGIVRSGSLMITRMKRWMTDDIGDSEITDGCGILRLWGY